MSDITTWRTMIVTAMKRKNETWDDLEAITIVEGELDRRFDSGYGGIDGASFCAWTKNYVYFPATYDGSEWCACVPRNPVDRPVDHIGGG